MTKQEFKHLLSNNIIVLDGATGSCLQQEGMPTGICPEQWILENPEVMLELQKEYVLAGSDIIYAPTFTCNRIKLDEYGLVDRIGEINTALVELSKEAIRIAQKEGAHKPCYVAGDITMTGEQIVPIGTMPFEELVDIYKEQVGYLVEAGVDLIVVETMMSLQECRAAVLAIKETSDIPILVTLSFNEDGRTLYGTDPTTAVAVLQSLGVDAVGANCSSGADQMIPIIKEMASVSYIPIIAKPNCGMPILNNGVTVYNQTADEFLQGIDGLVNAGATIVGGCCGTNVECISKVSSYIDKMDKESVLECVIQKRVMARKLRMLSSERRSLVIEDDKKLFVVGERINPTGKKDLQASLREKNMDLIITMAEEQEEFGADVLDVNVGMNGIDEVEILFQAVTELSQAMNLPLSIDTSNVEAMEKALRNYPGRDRKSVV